MDRAAGALSLDCSVRFRPIADISKRATNTPMTLSAHLLLPILLAVGSSDALAQTSSSKSVVSCGGVTDVATVDRYFSDLRQALTKSGPKKRFNAFVRDTFGVRSRQGHTLYFNVQEVGSVTPGRISIEEWREISRRGGRSLQSAGWRGCFMNHGKVWFEGSEESGFRLTLIARDVPWAKPEKGDALP